MIDTCEFCEKEILIGHSGMDHHDCELKCGCGDYFDPSEGEDICDKCLLREANENEAA